MSHHVLKPPPRSGVPTLQLVAAVLLFAAALALAWGLGRPIGISVDGHEIAIPARVSVAYLRSIGVVRAEAGALRAVNGSIIRMDGGDPPVVTRNGRPVSTSSRVFDGDVIVSRNGADVAEPTITVDIPIPFKSRVIGNGSVMRLENPGSVGIRSITKGKVSGFELPGRVVRSSVDMVVIRTRPTPSEKLIALTFDDGPWVGQTDRILAILKHEGIHATFFMLGGRVKAHPEIAKRVADQGNLIGNHTWSHRLLTVAAPAVVQREIAYGASTIRAATGVEPTWFRPPYGSIDASVWAQTRALRLRVALWDVDTRDWSRPGVARIVATANAHARSGAIVLMHDGGGNRDQTIAALPIMIRDLKARGFIFVTLDQLAGVN